MKRATTRAVVQRVLLFLELAHQVLVGEESALKADVGREGWLLGFKKVGAHHAFALEIDNTGDNVTFVQVTTRRTRRHV